MAPPRLAYGLQGTLNMTKTLLLTVVSVIMATSAYAQSVPDNVTYTTNPAVFNNIGGNAPGTTVTLGSASGVFTGDGTYNVSNVTFTATGLPSPSSSSTGAFDNTVVTSDGTFPFTIPFSLQTGASDVLTLGGNGVDIPGYNVSFNQLVLSVGGAAPSSGTLTATVVEVPGQGSSAVPEPPTWALMIAGLALTGFAVRGGLGTRTGCEGAGLPASMPTV